MKYRFSADRQLFFYVNIGGQQRLVKFGERNAFGASEFVTMLRETAEAIRRHSLYKRGVIRELVSEEQPAEPHTVAKAEKPRKKTEKKEEQALQVKKNVTEQPTKKEILEARNFTQAKSLLAKKLGIAYSDIKTPDQLMQLAKQASVEIVYSK